MPGGGGRLGCRSSVDDHRVAVGGFTAIVVAEGHRVSPAHVQREVLPHAVLGEAPLAEEVLVGVPAAKNEAAALGVGGLTHRVGFGNFHLEAAALAGGEGHRAAVAVADDELAPHSFRL